MTRQSSSRILLDTNVWNYLADHADAATLAAAARKGSASIVVAPAVVYESLVVNDPATRLARSQLLTDKRWLRLMPEA
jgi:predicted nucleic acid-binding protein